VLKTGFYELPTNYKIQLGTLYELEIIPKIIQHTYCTDQVPFKTSDGALKPNSADWLSLIRTGMPYAYGDMGDSVTRETVNRLVDLLNLLLDATADYDPDDEDANEASQIKCRNLRLKAIEGLSCMERDFPETELSPFVHEILHVSEFVYRWNNVRNYWCFVTERFVG
jgi:hypothetical protein